MVKDITTDRGHAPSDEYRRVVSCSGVLIEGDSTLGLVLTIVSDGLTRSISPKLSSAEALSSKTSESTSKPFESSNHSNKQLYGGKGLEKLIVKGANHSSLLTSSSDLTVWWISMNLLFKAATVVGAALI